MVVFGEGEGLWDQIISSCFFPRNDLKAEFSSATSGMLIESMCLVH